MKLIRALKKKARGAAELLYALHPSHQATAALARMEKRASALSVTPSMRHLESAMRWLKLAQNSSETG